MSGGTDVPLHADGHGHFTHGFIVRRFQDKNGVIFGPDNPIERLDLISGGRAFLFPYFALAICHENGAPVPQRSETGRPRGLGVGKPL